MSDDLYHVYEVEHDDPNGGKTIYRDIHIPDHIHKAHGFGDDGKLKNPTMLASLTASALSIGKDLVKGFKYAGKMIRK